MIGTYFMKNILPVVCTEALGCQMGWHGNSVALQEHSQSASDLSTEIKHKSMHGYFFKQTAYRDYEKKTDPVTLSNTPLSARHCV
jgi:hypothetical protein